MRIFSKSKKPLILKMGMLLMALAALSFQPAKAVTYDIDSQGRHAGVHFRIMHLGFSWMMGRFNEFEGSFYYDPAAPEDSWVKVTVETESLDTNHAVRDDHLRAAKYLDTDRYPTAVFESTRVVSTGEGSANIEGNLTLHGQTHPIVIAADFIGAGTGPRGKSRVGFTGTADLERAKFGIDAPLGPGTEVVKLILDVEGIARN